MCNIQLSSSNISCNSQGKEWYPIFSSDNVTISTHMISVSPHCPLSCPIPSSTLTYGVFACQPCSPGSISVNNLTNCSACPVSYEVLDNKCVICPSGTFSGSNTGCIACPIFSSQIGSGTDHCTCFTNTLVKEDNLDQCNNEFWGFIIGGIYLMLIVGITLYWMRRRNYEPEYSQIS